MTEQRKQPAPYSSALALAMGRPQQLLGDKYQDQDLIARGSTLELRALDAIAQGKDELPPTN